MTRKRKPASNQMQMFSTEDLPLFSGTAQRGKVERFDPPPAVFQPALASCPICLDGGMIRRSYTPQRGKLVLTGLQYCNCAAGQAARKERKQ